MDFLSHAPSLVGVFVVVVAILYLVAAVVVGLVRDRHGVTPERNYVLPSDTANRNPHR